MRRSHSLQLLFSIVVFLFIALIIIFNVYHRQGTQDNGVIQRLSLFSIAALGGSFLGTTVFWILFKCDFSNRKKLRKMDHRIKKTESIEEINQEVINEIRKDIRSIASTQRRIERSQEEQERWQKKWEKENAITLDLDIKDYIHEEVVKKLDSLDSKKEPEEPEPKSNKP